MGLIGAGAGTIVRGQRKITDVAAARRRPQIIQEVEFNISADIAPIVLFLDALNKVKTVRQTSYFHLEDDEHPLYCIVNGSEADPAHTTIDVETGEGDRCAVGYILRNVRTQEHMLVTAVAASIVTVTRAYQGTSGAALLDHDELQVIGMADTEGNTSPDAHSGEPTICTNYVQLFRRAVQLSRRALESDDFGTAESEREHGKAQRAIFNMIERAFIWGRPDSGSSTTRTATAGAIYNISTNLHENIGTLDEDEVNDWLMAWFRRVNGTKQDMRLFCGELVLKAFNGFGRDYLEVGPDDDTLGMEVLRYRSNFGTVKLVKHGLFTTIGSAVSAANYGWQGVALGLNFDKIFKVKFGSGGDVHLLKNRQENDRDGIKDEYLADLGFAMACESQHMYSWGVTG